MNKSINIIHMACVDYVYIFHVSNVIELKIQFEILILFKIIY